MDGRPHTSDFADKPDLYDSGSICKQTAKYFTSEKFEFSCEFRSFYTNINSWMCINTLS